MQRISGDLLRSTTLQSLGLYNGKCMLRYDIQKKKDGGPQQANVSGPLKRTKPLSPTPPNLDLLQNSKTSKNNEISDDTGGFSLPLKSNMDVDQVLPVAVEIPNEQEYRASENRQFPIEPDILGSSHLNSVPDVIADQAITSAPDVLAVSDNVYPIDLLSSNTTNKMDIEESSHFASVDSSSMDVVNSPDFIPVAASHSPGIAPDFVPGAPISVDNVSKAENSPEVILLGDHSSFIFSQDDAHTAKFEEESNDFFDLDKNEVLRMHQERRREIQELEERPLLTKGMRNAQESSQMLWTLRHHPVTQIRIVFPDRLIIQATFKPSHTIKNVMDFVRPMLRLPDMDFTLCTHFPKLDLNPSVSLCEAKCIPRALLYFTTDLNCEIGQSWLSSETKEKKSTFEAAESAVVKTRSFACETSLAPTNMDVSAQGGPSVLYHAPAEAQLAFNPPSMPKKQSSKKPKWFKL